MKELLPGWVRPQAAYLYRWLKYRMRPSLNGIEGVGSGVLKCCIAYNKHGGYALPRSSLHTTVSQALLAGRVYESDTVDFLVSRGRGEIIHAGAFAGDFLPALSQAYSKIWAFEPHPENFRCAELTIKINEIRNVELVKRGLGECRGAAILQTKDHDGPLGASSRISEAGDEVIVLLALDETIPANSAISVIHLDVEGYEQKVLAGAMQLIERCRPILVLETLPDSQWIAKHLTPLGYRISGRVDENTILSVQDR